MDKRFGQRLLLALKTDPLAIILLALVAVIIAMSVGGTWFSSYDPVQVDYKQALLPPSSEHWLGTDNYGRDVLSRLMHGGIASLGASLIAVSLIISLSLAIGLAAGYFGGWLDMALTRLMDVLFSFPQLVLAIALASLMGPGLTSLMIAVAAVSWPSFARIFRSFVLSVRNEGYVQAARTSGIPAWKIITTHILGSIAGPILVLVTLDIGSIILSIASMSFLGLGIRPPQPEWGAMLNEGRAYIEEAPWLFLAPGLTIFLMVLGTNYLGDTLKDALEPRAIQMPRLFGGSKKRKRMEPVVVKAHSSKTGQHANVCSHPELPVTAGNTASVLSIDGLHVAASEGMHGQPKPILENIYLELKPGECLGLVGESGSGKSTLAHAIMGLLRSPLEQTAGTIRLMGENTSRWEWNDWRKVRGSHVAYITQDPMDSLNPVLTIGEQLRECLIAHRDKDGGLSQAEAKRKVRELLEQTGLPEETYGRFPHQLSGGMRQRVVIAMAVINEPQIIVADEPTTALDVSTQARILELLIALRNERKLALIFITHDLRLVTHIADRICVMRNGRMIEQGDVRSVFTNPREAYTKQLLESIPSLRILSQLRKVK
ncbi:nickel transporter permease [Paenibacillus piri]|uniref:Dipeptide/oligopeptide/nickel ABC transporter permease/ATP-binding protein n=1 Tax=Paenibacillus piri TaxID=2547395 RepID=A0A4R5KJY6_9BACL|nr:nickel transporter permease [Paenibacillus piri]TDF95148.1 dipeptide/oligopeptide/nickel ABC transporter permease/ATP-binding protein [Paenibacillus piri]